MVRKKNWKTAFYQAWDKFGITGTFVSFIPPSIYAIYLFIKNPELFREFLGGDFITPVIIYLFSWIVIIAFGTIYYLIRKPIKIGKGINKITLESRQFYTLAYHAEWIVKNANAKVVANFLLKKYLEIARTTEIGNITYSTENIEFFDPEKHGTLEYAMVVHGTKMIPVHGFFNIGASKATSDPIFESIDMFIITVNQGGKNTARVTFDTDIRGLFSIFSMWLQKDLIEVFTINKIKIG